MHTKALMPTGIFLQAEEHVCGTTAYSTQKLPQDVKMMLLVINTDIPRLLIKS